MRQRPGSSSPAASSPRAAGRGLGTLRGGAAHACRPRPLILLALAVAAALAFSMLRSAAPGAQLRSTSAYRPHPAIVDAADVVLRVPVQRAATQSPSALPATTTTARHVHSTLRQPTTMMPASPTLTHAATRSSHKTTSAAAAPTPAPPQVAQHTTTPASARHDESSSGAPPRVTDAASAAPRYHVALVQRHYAAQGNTSSYDAPAFASAAIAQGDIPASLPLLPLARLLGTDVCTVLLVVHSRAVGAPRDSSVFDGEALTEQKFPYAAWSAGADRPSSQPFDFDAVMTHGDLRDRVALLDALRVRRLENGLKSLGPVAAWLGAPAPSGCSKELRVVHAAAPSPAAAASARTVLNLGSGVLDVARAAGGRTAAAPRRLRDATDRLLLVDARVTPAHPAPHDTDEDEPAFTATNTTRWFGALEGGLAGTFTPLEGLRSTSSPAASTGRTAAAHRRIVSCVVANTSSDFLLSAGMTPRLTARNDLVLTSRLNGYSVHDPRANAVEEIVAADPLCFATVPSVWAHVGGVRAGAEASSHAAVLRLLAAGSAAKAVVEASHRMSREIRGARPTIPELNYGVFITTQLHEAAARVQDRLSLIQSTKLGTAQSKSFQDACPIHVRRTLASTKDFGILSANARGELQTLTDPVVALLVRATGDVPLAAIAERGDELEEIVTMIGLFVAGEAVQNDVVGRAGGGFGGRDLLARPPAYRGADHDAQHLADNARAQAVNVKALEALLRDHVHQGHIDAGDGLLTTPPPQELREDAAVPAKRLYRAGKAVDLEQEFKHHQDDIAAHQRQRQRLANRVFEEVKRRTRVLNTLDAFIASALVDLYAACNPTTEDLGVWLVSLRAWRTLRVPTVQAPAAVRLTATAPGTPHVLAKPAAAIARGRMMGQYGARLNAVARRRRITDGVAVTWTGPCLCCGFTNEIALLVTAIAPLVRTRIAVAPHCFCSGMPGVISEQLKALYVDPDDREALVAAGQPMQQSSLERDAAAAVARKTKEDEHPVDAALQRAIHKLDDALIDGGEARRGEWRRGADGRLHHQTTEPPTALAFGRAAVVAEIERRMRITPVPPRTTAASTHEEDNDEDAEASAVRDDSIADEDETAAVTPAAAHPTQVFVNHIDPLIGSTLMPKIGRYDYFVSRSMYEFSTIRPEWVLVLNATTPYDEVWVPCKYVADAFVRSGVPRGKITIVPEPIDTRFYAPSSGRKLPLPASVSQPEWRHGVPKGWVVPRGGDALPNDFKFLSIFKWEDRKGWDVLLKAYFTTFSGRDKVSLIIVTQLFAPGCKCDLRDPDAILHHIDRFAAGLGGVNLKNLPYVEVITQELTEREIVHLYASCDAFVLPSRGEGWGLPVIQAMAMALPTITTRYSGMTEFATDDTVLFVDAAEVVLPEPVRKRYGAPYDAKWAEPDVAQVGRHMRRVATGMTGDERRALGERARAHVVRHFSQEVVGRQVARELQRIDAAVRSTTRGGRGDGRTK